MKTENEISYLIRGAVFRVYNRLGPGLLESVYEKAMAYELKKNGLIVDCQLGIPMKYDDIQFDIGFRLDILVENAVIIEIKSVDALMNVHHKQLLTYLRLFNKRLGLLINFNTYSIERSIIRIANNL
jgi:GxxExxY protein